METHIYRRYVDLYSSYTDDRLSFLIKTPKGGIRQELHCVHFL